MPNTRSPQPEAPNLEPLIQQHEAAARVGRHVCALIRARKAGELEAVKFGRSVYYRPSDLVRWINAHTVGGVV